MIKMMKSNDVSNWDDLPVGTRAFSELGGWWDKVSHKSPAWSWWYSGVRCDMPTSDAVWLEVPIGLTQNKNGV